MKALTIAAAALGLTLLAPLQTAVGSRSAEDYEALKREAEALFASGGYERARRLYERADGMELDGFEERWVDFRLADCAWRAAASSDNPDTTDVERAAKALDELLRRYERPEDRDRVWAEIQESKGDYHWAHRNWANYGGAWPWYSQALDWWAGSADLELARERYLGIVFRMARPGWFRSSWSYGYYGNWIDEAVLQNAVEIAVEPEDEARARFYLALSLKRYGDWSRRQRVVELLEHVVDQGPSTETYDDALFELAQWYEQVGHVRIDENGSYSTERDYVRAVELYRRLLGEFEQGETRHWRSAERAIQNITSPTLSLAVDRFFLPKSVVQYRLNWRNLERVDLALYQVDLTADVDLSEDDGPHTWLQGIDLRGKVVAKRWSHATGDDGRHVPGNAQLVVDGEVPTGAYVLEATSGARRMREIVLVSDANLVTKATGDELLSWFCATDDAEPIDDAKVTVWERFHDGNGWRWAATRSSTAADGTFRHELGGGRRSANYFVAAKRGNRQAFALGGTPGKRSASDSWRVYATTDRPAYRPEDTVQWRFTARTYDGSRYATPANAKVTYVIQDPRQTQVEEKTVELSAFGSAWGSLELSESMALGEYTVWFRDERGSSIGSATLFRLEEFKLPEFEVSVNVPEGDDGRRKLFRVGEEVEVEIEAGYYFGGAVREATVEVLVYQKPYWHTWRRARDYPWYYENPHAHWGWWGPGNLVQQSTLQTDAEGKARVAFATPQNAGQDFEYTVEARVTDASRREVAGSGTLRVTRQQYYVNLRADHNLYRPGSDVTVEIEAADANAQPVETEGRVVVTRQRWSEVWIDPGGKEVRGPALERLRRSLGAFPPPPEKGKPGWTLKFRGYEQEQVLERTVKTDADGKASLRFGAVRDGYYGVTWTSRDAHGAQVTGGTAVWVCDERTRDMGFMAAGVDLIVDKDTFREGERVPVMLSTQSSGRWVLFTVESGELLDVRVVHVEGDVKLLHVDVGDEHVPNVTLMAVTVDGGQVHMDQEHVIVPPEKFFLDVEVLADADEREPGTSGTLTVVTKDVNGEPVSAEVSLGLVDASVLAIQSEYAVDPRQFFYGEKRQHAVYTQGTWSVKSFVRLVEVEGRVLEEQHAALERLKDGENELAWGDVMFDQAASEEAPAIGGGGGGRAREMLRSPAGPSSPGAGAPTGSDDFFLGSGAKRGAFAADFDVEGGPGAEPGGAPVEVRHDFRTTAAWEPGLVTGPDGRATVEVDYPDTTTRWVATARAADAGTRVGMGKGETRTRLPLITRLQAPRFFVVGDEVTLSAVYNNNTSAAMSVRPAIEVEGLRIVGWIDEGRVRKDALAPVSVPAHGEARVDWMAHVEEAGDALVRVIGRGEEFADAMERELRVHPGGIEVFAATSGKLDGERAAFGVELPADRRPGTTSFEVQVAPSLAVTMLDALPYLVDYPYGCTEQTLSRFVPAAVVAKTLEDQGLSPGVAMTRVFGGIEREFVDRTHDHEKVSLEKLDDVIGKGLERLYGLQHTDGGWAWWKHGDSNPFMTAYVVWGLSLAIEAGVDVDAGVVRRGAQFLDLHLVEAETRPDLQAWMLHALAVCGSTVEPFEAKFADKAFANVMGQHTRLNAYTRALAALAAHHMGRADEARLLCDNLLNGAIVDENPESSLVQEGEERTHRFVQKTAHWGEDGVWWRWSEGGVEATAFALLAMMTIDPGHELVDPATTWLVRNRRGAQWSNTRDTAIVVLALNQYLRTSGELGRSVGYAVKVNGRELASVSLAPDDILRAPASYPVDPELLADGVNRIELVRTDGDGPLYFSARAEFFSDEDPIPPRGNEVFVRRRYYRLAGKPTLLKGYVYERVPLEDGDELRSGERVEVVLTVETKNHLEYLLFEDLKPAGFEATEVKSGEAMWARELKRGEVEERFGEAGREGELHPDRGGSRGRWWHHGEVGYTGRTESVHQELRDRKVALFVDELPQGVWELRYDLRAEVPGEFRALPVTGHAMYVPEIRCNGGDLRVTVLDR